MGLLIIHNMLLVCRACGSQLCVEIDTTPQRDHKPHAAVADMAGAAPAAVT